MATFRDSWALTKASFRMIREDPALLALPAISGLMLFGVLLVFSLPLIVAFLLNPGGIVTFAGTDAGKAVLVVLYVALYFVLVFVGNFFFAALIGAAMMKLEGGHPSVGDGVRFARRHVRRILLWSLIAASIGLLIRAVSARFRGLGGLIIGAVAGASWGIATYFILPVIVFENGGAWASLKRSASLFIQTFGRTILSNLFVALIALGLGFLGVGLVVAGILLLFGGVLWGVGVALILLGVLVWIFTAVLVSAVEGILRAALYRYATTGRIAPSLVPREYLGGRMAPPMPPGAPPPPPPPPLPSYPTG